MKKTSTWVALISIAGLALTLPVLAQEVAATKTYAYQPLNVKIVAYFEGVTKTNGSDVTVTKTPAGKINNAVIIEKLGLLTKNSFSPKAQLMVKSLVNEQTFQNTLYNAVIVDGDKEVDVHSYLFVGTDNDEITLSGKANLAKGKVAIESMGALYFYLYLGGDSACYLYGCGMGETALVKQNKEIVGYVQHWKSPEAGYRVWEGEDTMFDGMVSIGHVTKVVTRTVN